jgi:hypothetical protein
MNLAENQPDENSILKRLNSSSIKVVQIEYYKNIYSSVPGEKITISNVDTITQIENLLKLLPDNGQVFVKFNQDASKNNVILTDANGKSDTIAILANRIKTPATSFYLPSPDAENTFVNLVIDTLIQKKLQQDETVSN